MQSRKMTVIVVDLVGKAPAIEFSAISTYTSGSSTPHPAHSFSQIDSP